MTDRIVSIRIPAEIVEQLRTISIEQHFKDVSELVRAVIRKRSSASTEFGLLTKDQLVTELERLLQRLKQ
ncbi:MAG: ribbon-helix-helix protein, CopG family [Candidatus Woesearchaeota archaeon]